MVGLIFKDIIGAKKELCISGLMFVFFGLFSIVGGGESFYACMGALLAVGAIMAAGSITLDKLSGWDAFICSTPVTRKKVMLAKYVMVLLGDAISFLVVALVNRLSGSVLPPMGLILIAAMLLFFNSVLFPITLKFGQSASLIIFLLLIFVPLGLALLLEKTGLLPPDFFQSLTTLQFLSGLPVEAAMLLVLLGSVLLFFCSYLLSVKIYEKKEF